MNFPVEVGRRAGVDAREWLWTAREAERTLGRMITAAREAGDLARGGERTDLLDADEKVATLSDLGISYDLAAYAVLLAGLADEVWAALRAAIDQKPDSALRQSTRLGGDHDRNCFELPR